MKRTIGILIVALVLTLSVASGAAYWSYQRVTGITTTAGTVTVGCVPETVRVAAPSTNSDNVRIDMSATATSTSKPFAPGQVEDMSIKTQSFSVIADTGTQSLDVTAFCK